MKTSLVGCTGFVGGNLAQSHAFDNLYNSKNIAGAFGANNGLVVYAGMPAEKFTANADPAADFARAEEALCNLRRMKPEGVVLISTVDVYPRPVGVYEDSPAGGKGGEAYGRHRLALEGWVREEWPEALIVRLPGLFGKGLKKNFIFDMLTLTPAMLVKEKFAELAEKEPLVRDAYRLADNGFYRLVPQSLSKAAALRAFFEHNDFNALSFTDSRSVYQFYSLAGLWADILRCQKHGLRLVNLATQPVEAGALYQMLHAREWENHSPKGPVRYDMRTRHGRDLGGLDNYIADRAEVVGGIAKFAAGYLGG